MEHPDKRAEVSVSGPGSVQEVPEQVISVVVTDESNEPDGILEKWSSDSWIFADSDTLMDTN